MAAAAPGAVKRAGKSLCAVVAATEAGGIGMAGKLPWKLPGDMAFFKRVTMGVSDTAKRNAVVMGRKTWGSIPRKFRPLPGRLNVVLSTSSDVREKEGLPDDVLVATSLDDAMEKLQSAAFADDVERIFVIGGAAAFAQVLASPLLDTLYFTRVHAEVPCDTFIPALSEDFVPVAESTRQQEGELAYTFSILQKGAARPETSVPPLSLTAFYAAAVHRTSTPSGAATTLPAHEEQQYLDIVRDILLTGVKRGDRTGTGTLSKFGVSMRFNLRGDVLPLLTTKRVFWRGVAEELLWFVSGDTSAGTLQAKDIHIWDGNGSKEFLEGRGLGHREEGDLGPVYGFQWRHFGAPYGTMHDDYSGQGVDQLAQVVQALKSEPTSRRIVLTAWNPAALPDMALPPCHMFAQFFVADGEVSCQMYQRSADMGLGVPFNIASYALLTRLVAQAAGLKAGELVHVIGDAHVYLNHVQALWGQLEREPRPFPRLTIDPNVTDMDAFRMEHFTLHDYKPHKSIKMTMAV